MSNYFRNFLHYLRVFQEFLGNRIYFVFALALLAAFSEGVGILMFMPLLQALSSDLPHEPSEHMTPALGGISEYIQHFLEMMGVANSTVAVLLLIATAFITKGVLTFGSQGYYAYMRAQLLRKLKRYLFYQYSLMTYSYYSERNAGHFINVITSQIDQALVAFQHLMQFGVQLVKTIIYIALAFLVAWRFGLMALAIGIFVLILFHSLNVYVRTLSRKTSREAGHLSKLLIQSLHGFKYLVATNQIEPLKKAIGESILRMTGQEMRRGIAETFTNSVREPMAVIFIVLIMLVQIQIFNQPLAPILVSILLFHRGLNAIVSVQGSLQRTFDAVGGLEMVIDEFAAQKIHQEPNGNIAIGPLSHSIYFENVHHSYATGLCDVINGVNLKIPVRTSVALVGKSGAGKSTLVDMVTLMLKPTNGSIYIDNVPGKDILLDSWRSQIGYVSQEAVVFDDTIANNICLWIGDPSKDAELMSRINKVAHLAHLGSFIETLPDGYHTKVGDRGVRLSGGQRQRLFIARELFRKPNLLILDEATSSLDSDSERAIQQSIDELKGHITVIIIAHRLSTIRNVDMICVFDQGKLIEQGTFEQLRDMEDSRFRELIAMQEL